MAQSYNLVDIAENVFLQGKMTNDSFVPRNVKTSPATYSKIISINGKNIKEINNSENKDIVKYLNIPSVINVNGLNGKPIMLTPEMIKKFIYNTSTLQGENSEIFAEIEEEVSIATKEAEDNESSSNYIEMSAEENDDIAFNFDNVDLPTEVSDIEIDNHDVDSDNYNDVNGFSEGNIYVEEKTDINQNISILTMYKEKMMEYAQKKEEKRKQQQELLAKLSSLEVEIDLIEKNEEKTIEECKEAYNNVKPTLDQLNIDPNIQFGIDLETIGITNSEVEDNSYQK